MHLGGHPSTGEALRRASGARKHGRGVRLCDGESAARMPSRKTSLIFPRTQGAIRMNKILLTVVLGTAVAAVAQGAAQPQAQPAAPQTAPQGAPQQKKEIKDPAEYNAYMGAVGQQDPAAKISGLEAFLTQYPNSVMKEDALEGLMGAYQQTNNAAKMNDTAQRVLQANPCNLRALALLAYTKRAAAEAGQNAQQNLTEGGQYAEKG